MEHVIVIRESDLRLERERAKLMIELQVNEDEDEGRLGRSLGQLVSPDRIIQHLKYTAAIAAYIQEAIDEEGNFVGVTGKDTYRFEGIKFSTDLVEALTMTNVLSSMMERTVFQLSEEGKKAEITGLVYAYSQIVKGMVSPLAAAVAVSASSIISSFVRDHPEIIRDITGGDDNLFDLIMSNYS